MSFEMMDLDEAHSPEETSRVHAHRVKNTQSKLPAFRFADLHRSYSLPVQPASIRRVSASGGYHVDTPPRATQGSSNPSPGALSSSRTASGFSVASTTIVHAIAVLDSGPGPDTVAAPCSSLAGGPGSAQLAETCNSAATSGPQKASSPHTLQGNRRPEAKRAPVSHSSNSPGSKSGPPPVLSSTRASRPRYRVELSQKPPEQSTSEWAQHQQQLLAPSYIKNNKSTKPERGHLSKKLPADGARVPPLLDFTSSTRPLRAMDSRGAYYRCESPEDEDMEDDRDQTLRALQGYPASQRGAASRRASGADGPEEGVEEHGSPSRTGDLFLDLALENLELQNSADKNAKRKSATERMSRIALPSNRSSLPNPSSSTTNPNAMNRSLDRDSVPSPYARSTAEQIDTAPLHEPFAYDKAAAHNRATSIPQTQADLNKSRYPPSANRSFPATPKVYNYRDASYDSTSSAASRRDSAPSAAGSARTHAYKQSNLSSFSTPRMYNFSSPSIPRAVEPGHSDDGSISTTAPSTVWDELDDLKSRIKKLELTGRLPPSSMQSTRPGADRPPTATTTATTMSTSPKRGRQISGAYSGDQEEYMHEEAHPLLHAALAKSKTILNTEIFKALENAAQDALAVASMVGSDGRQGYISSGQSVVGGPGGSIADRQLRRKADSMCRSLTELCIALSDSPPSPPGTASTARPTSREKELALQMQNASERERELKKSETAQSIMDRVKASPSRALSRLEARRNSLLRDTPQTTPRFEPGASLSATSGQPPASSLAGRRTSLLLGRSRQGAEEREVEDSRMDGAQDFRGPSRANTEIGVFRGEKRGERRGPNLRERNPAYSSQMTDREREREQERIEKERERERPVSTVSNLPVRRTYAHLGSATNSPSVMANRRRYLDRERDTSSVMERLALDRGNLARLQNSDAIGINRTRSLAGGNGALSRLRARGGIGLAAQNNDSNDTINSTRAETGGYTRSFGA